MLGEQRTGKLDSGAPGAKRRHMPMVLSQHATESAHTLQSMTQLDCKHNKPDHPAAATSPPNRLHQRLTLVRVSHRPNLRMCNAQRYRKNRLLVMRAASPACQGFATPMDSAAAGAPTGAPFYLGAAVIAVKSFAALGQSRLHSIVASLLAGTPSTSRCPNGLRSELRVCRRGRRGRGAEVCGGCCGRRQGSHGDGPGRGGRLRARAGVRGCSKIGRAEREGDRCRSPRRERDLLEAPARVCASYQFTRTCR